MNAKKFCLPHITLRGLSNENIGAPILLCLHGWLDNSASFLPLTPFLKNYHIVIIDLPGHGLSEHRGEGSYYHFSDWLNDIYALIESQQWQTVTLIGHSMGGMIASAFSAAFPEKIKRLVLLDSIGFITTHENQTTEQLRKGLLSRHKNTLVKKYYPSIDSAVKARLKVSDLQYPHAELIIKRSLIESEEGVSWRYDKKLQQTSLYRFTHEQASNVIKSISCRCLFIGSENTMMNSAFVNFSPLFNDISCYHLVGGHHIHMEKPQQVSKLIKNFLI